MTWRYLVPPFMTEGVARGRLDQEPVSYEDIVLNADSDVEVHLTGSTNPMGGKRIDDEVSPLQAKELLDQMETRIMRWELTWKNDELRFRVHGHHVRTFPWPIEPTNYVADFSGVYEDDLPRDAVEPLLSEQLGVDRDHDGWRFGTVEPSLDAYDDFSADRPIDTNDVRAAVLRGEVEDVQTLSYDDADYTEIGTDEFFDILVADRAPEDVQVIETESDDRHHYDIRIRDTDVGGYDIQLRVSAADPLFEDPRTEEAYEHATDHALAQNE